LSDLVVDANVVIKWFVDEPGTDEALALRRHRLFAPDLLMVECANALWKKVRRDEFSAEEALAAAQLLEHADVELESARPLARAATELATALDHPVYDCLYVVLAQALGHDLITADERLTQLALPARYTVRAVSLAEAAAR